MKQRKPWLPTIVLVGVLAVLVAYVLLVEAKREPPPEEGAQPTSAPLWEFRGSDLTQITVTKGEQTTAVERSGDTWRMLQPQAGEADSARLNGFVYRVASMTYSRTMADVADLTDFGLPAPELRATLVLSDGTTIKVSVGAENPRRTARYVQKEGDPLVYLVSGGDLDGLFRLVDEPPFLPAPTPLPTPQETPTPSS